MIRKKLRQHFSHPRFIILLMLFGILIPYLNMVVTAFPKKVSAEPSQATLLDNETLKVSVNHELQQNKAIWTIYYQQAANTFPRTVQFKLVKNDRPLTVSDLSAAAQVKFTNETEGWLSGAQSSTDAVPIHLNL